MGSSANTDGRSSRLHSAPEFAENRSASLHSRTTPSEFLRASTFLHRLTGSICLGAVPCPYMFPIHFRSHTHPQSPHIPHFVHVDSIPAKTSARGAVVVGPRSRPCVPVPWTFHHHAIMSNTAKSPASHPPRPATGLRGSTLQPGLLKFPAIAAVARRQRRRGVGVDTGWGWGALSWSGLKTGQTARLKVGCASRLRPA